MKKKFKITAAILTTSLLVTPISSMINQYDNVAKADNKKISKTINYEPTEKEINELAEALEFFDKNSIKNEKGEIIDFNFKKIEEKYGKHEAIDVLKKEIEYNKYKNLFRSAYLDCMKDAMYDFFGVTAVSTMFSYGIGKYIEKKLWKEAAKIAIKATGAGFVVSLAATLSWYGVKCAL